MQTRQKLLELSKELQTQDNRHTDHPLFVVQVDVKRYGDRSWCNDAERKSDWDSEHLCDACAEKYENNEDLPDYCEDCDDEMFVWFNWEKDFDLQAGCFLTAKACDEHIRLNSYHYTNPRSYAISAWRNPEMQFLMDFVAGLGKCKTCDGDGIIEEMGDGDNFEYDVIGEHPCPQCNGTGRKN